MHPEPAVPAAVPQRARNPLAGLVTIFFAPAETFASLGKRPWLVPLIAACLLALVVNVMVVNVIGMGTIMRNELEARPRIVEQLGQEKIDQMVHDAESSQTRKYLTYASAFFFLPIALSLISGVLLGALLMTGGNTTFSSVLGACTWASYASLAISTLATAAFVSAVKDFSGVETSNLIALNPTIFMNRAESSPALYSIASSLDLLSFYNMFLIGLGVSRLSSGISFAKAFITVVLLWALYVLGKAGFAAMF